MRILLNISLLALLLFSCEQQTVRMEAYEIHGIDVSHYQSTINWDTVAVQDIHFAFVKATEGATFFDSIFCFNWEEIPRVGLKRGAYHFYRPTVPASVQALNFIQNVTLNYGDLPPVLDVEVTDGVAIPVILADLKIWMELVEAHFEVKPIIYTNVRFYNENLAGHFDDHYFWIARYNRSEPVLIDGRNWHFWQYGNRGQLKGIFGDVDFNVFYGDRFQLEDICHAPKATLN